jgi:hypothetical protein
MVIGEGSQLLFREGHVLWGRRRNDEQRMAACLRLRRKIVNKDFENVLPDGVSQRCLGAR